MVKPQLPKSRNSNRSFAQFMATVGLFIISLIIYRSLPAYRTPTAPPQSSVRKPTAKSSPERPGDSLPSSHAKASERTKCNWRPEPLQGICDVTKSTDESKRYTSAEDCERACCSSESCVTFQYRTKEGCLFGADTRLGAEKDGVSAWCEPRAPDTWHGQRVKEKDGSEVEGACSPSGWNGNELRGQCFGLGPKRVTGADTPEACRDACCASRTCQMWQWRKDAGCFYNKSGHGCREADPEDLEKFYGRRKVQPGREYKPYAYSKDFADLAGLEK